jgi:hypothetical protein
VTQEERAARVCGKCRHRIVDEWRGRGTRRVYNCRLDEVGCRYRVGPKATCHQSWINCYQPIDDAPKQEEERDEH